MGLGTKIKTALQGHEHTTSNTSPSRVNAPGAYPEDDAVTQRHSDGKEYVAPHGSLVGNKDKTSANSGRQTHATSNSIQIDMLTCRPDLTASPSQRNKLRRDVEGFEDTTTSKPHYGRTSRDSGVDGFDSYDQPTTTKSNGQGGAYWGDLSHSTSTTKNTRDLPERSRFREETSTPITNSHDRHHEGTTSGLSHSNTMKRDTPDRLHDPRLMDQAVGGGVYDSNGMSHEHRGISREFDQDDVNEFRRGDEVVPTSHRGTGAGYGAHEYSQRGQQQQQQGYATNSPVMHQPAPGMPRSSMLDVDDNNNGNEYGRQHSNVPRSMLDVDGPTAMHNRSDFARTSPPNNSSANYTQPSASGPHAGFAEQQALGHSMSVSNKRASSEYSGVGNNNTTSGSAGGFGGSQLNSNNNGRSHFGPGHEGSKVMHTCEHCGNDNDISRYFSKDVVYRLGQ